MQILSMSLLSEMRDKLTKSLTVCIDLNALNESLLKNIQQAIERQQPEIPCKKLHPAVYGEGQGRSHAG